VSERHLRDDESNITLEMTEPFEDQDNTRARAAVHGNRQLEMTRARDRSNARFEESKTGETRRLARANVNGWMGRG